MEEKQKTVMNNCEADMKTKNKHAIHVTASLLIVKMPQRAGSNRDRYVSTLTSFKLKPFKNLGVTGI